MKVECPNCHKVEAEKLKTYTFFLGLGICVVGLIIFPIFPIGMLIMFISLFTDKKKMICTKCRNKFEVVNDVDSTKKASNNQL